MFQNPEKTPVFVNIYPHQPYYSEILTDTQKQHRQIIITQPLNYIYATKIKPIFKNGLVFNRFMSKKHLILTDSGEIGEWGKIGEEKGNDEENR